MTDALRSVGRFTWSMSVFGASQAAQMVAGLGRTGAGAELAAALDTVSGEAERRLGPQMKELLRTGDALQRGGLDAAFDAGEPWLLGTKSVAAAVALRGSLGMAELAARTADPALGGASRRRLRTLRDRMEVFQWFQFAPSILRLPAPRDGAAAATEAGSAAVRATGRATGRDRETFEALWLLEGLGYAHGEAAWDGEVLLESRLRFDPKPPREHRLPLHTGLGLSLARRFLPRLRAAEGPELVERLADFRDLCRRSALPGYGLPVFEALGLCVRQMAADRLGAFDRALGDLPPDGDDGGAPGEARAAFWHGVGRALVFLPSQLPPVSIGRPLGKARAEAPDDLGRRNAAAGVAWAVTLAHLRHPEILETFLERALPADERDTSIRDAIAHGIQGALSIWIHHVAPLYTDPPAREPWLSALVSHRPEGAAEERWRALVAEPARAAAAAQGSPELPWRSAFRILPEGAP